MDVHLITEAGVELRDPEDLPALLERREGLVWADIPRIDREAAKVLAEVRTLWAAQAAGGEVVPAPGSRPAW